MGRSHSFPFFVCCLLGVSCAWADPATYQYNSASGKWTQAQTQPSPTIAADPTLDRAEQLLAAHQYEQVHDLTLAWLLKNPKAPDRDRGVFMLAEAYFALGDRLWCFFQCDELLENFPDSRLFFPALNLQYRVADEYLKGYKKRFLGLPIIPMEDSALEMLFRIQERAPGSPVAEQSLQRTADYYYRNSQFDLAADAYGAFLRIYPRSPAAPRARLRQAYSNFAQFHGPAYDATPLLDARAEFSQIQAMTPELANEEGVQQFIDRIDEQLAAKIRWDAEYYLRVHERNGAVFLYRSLILRYPNSRDAQAARLALEKMPASALAQPWPPESAVQLPFLAQPTSRPVLGPNP